MSESLSPSRRLTYLGWGVLFFLALCAIESALTLIYLASIPSDSKNALVFGFSTQRLLMIGIVAVGMVVFILAFLREKFRSTDFIQKYLDASITRQRAIFALIVLFATIGWLLSFLPDYQMGAYLAYYQRLKPLLIWVTLILIEAALTIVIIKIFYNSGGNKENEFLKKRTLIASVIILAGFVFFWALVALTGVGVGAGNNYWNKVGVPILGVQILAAIIFGLIEFYLENRLRLVSVFQKHPWLFDLVIFTLIWAIAAVCWVNTPIAPSRFNTQPLPPNYASYPFSDAQEYNLNAQRILLGKGIGIEYVDKPLHLVFLVLLHVLGGQNFNQVILIQTILLGCIPALIYLLGKSIYNRMAGIIAAMMAIFIQINAIQSTNLIQVSNAKMMLSEPLTAVGMIIVSLVAVRWLKTPQKWWQNLMVLAGVTGICSLIRLNVVMVLPVILLVMAFQLKWRWKKVILGTAVVMIFFTAALTPWIIRNTVVADSPIVFIKNKVMGVIWRKRLTPILQSNPTGLNQITPSPSSGNAFQTPEPAISSVEGKNSDGAFALILPFATNYAHNLISTILMVPPVLQQGDIFHVIREPYWDSEWNGQFTSGGVIVLGFNLILISLGLGAAWNRARLAGIFPFLAFLAYHLSNAISVVSGGRYIVPVDWVVYFYFAIGLAEIILFILNIFTGTALFLKHTDDGEEPGLLFPWKKVPLILSLMLLIGVIPWTVESIYPDSYPIRSTEEILSDFTAQINFGDSGITQNDIDIFMKEPEAVLLEGKAFYPRFFQPGQGDTASTVSPFGGKSYPHFGFIVQGEGRDDINLYLEDTPESFQNGTEVMVLGCKGTGSVDAISIVTTSGPKQTLVRSALNGLKCPLPDP